MVYYEYLEKIDNGIKEARASEVEEDLQGKTPNGATYSGAAFVSEEKNKKELAIEFTQNDEYVDSLTITTTDIRTAWRNPLLRATIKKLEKFIFEGAELLVVPPDEISDEVKDKETAEVQTMVETIDDYAMQTVLRMRQAWLGEKKYGPAIFERIYGKVPGIKGKSYFGPVVFKSLPGYSFDVQPTEVSVDQDRYVCGELLKGIVYDLDNNEMQFWQRQGLMNEPVRIKNENIIFIRDEASENPDGESVISTLVPLIKQLNFADKCLMRSVMRAGAPNLDVIIHEYRDEAAPMNADAWDMAKAFSEGKKIGQNWSNSTVLEHPDCIELKPLDWSKMAIDPIKVVNFINERILYALIPRDFTENKGIAISQTGSSSLDMLNLWARGEQAQIEREFVKEWKTILAKNGKEGWRVEIVWRDMTADSSNELWDRVRIARDVQVFTANEIREIVEYPSLSDEQRDEIEKMPGKGHNIEPGAITGNNQNIKNGAKGGAPGKVPKVGVKPPTS